MSSAPLAHRVRPKTLDDFVGQEEIIGPGRPLRTLIQKDAIGSVILAGPPGTGKTTLAKIIAEATSAQFTQLNAVTSGIKDLRAVCEEAERLRTTFKQRTVLFVDEIHRFNTAQQDALLPFVESGAVTLIGATTQNPYFDVNQALVSRSHVYLLKPLDVTHLKSVLIRAVAHPEGLAQKVKVSDEAIDRIAQMSNGDARVALNLLELAAMTADGTIDLKQAEALLRERSKRYDRTGEDHYNTISAFIKSMRGSDVDAALIWLFKMIQSGEDPRFLFRRIMIFASEDVGNADPRALQMVLTAQQAFEVVGLPEGEYFLAHACIYVTQAPKSNAVTRAMGAVKEIIRTAATLEVPNHLRNAPLKGMKDQGYGKGYAYPHDDPQGVVRGEYFPVGVAQRDLYEPTDRGFEIEIRERMQKAKEVIRGD